MQSNGKNYRWTFDKLVRPEAGRKLVDNIQRIYDADFSVIVYNFLDILSHARTETDIIRELTEDEASFRFADALVVRTLRPLHAAQTPLEAGTHGHHHLRPRHDPRRQPDPRDGRPRDLAQPALQDGAQPLLQPARSLRNHAAGRHQLPRINLSSSYIFAYNTDFLVYNNDANRFIRYYKNTFQHGGISMEEMIVPISY